ncbi:anti-repressor SinI family protein [Peribacillus frigoritolerans]|uniref:anti-repressor SinI family protein n=1 Tax=Peribacillus castrilensis TaxID=2897690 RepID=UPI002DD043E8|nr:anti-repressor SinI family protein [Peribacillus castrilensis]
MKESHIDVQWLLLILEAKKSGLTQKEIRSFLSNHSNNKDVTRLKDNLNGHSHIPLKNRPFLGIFFAPSKYR